mgnify:CR=1 FL=1
MARTRSKSEEKRQQIMKAASVLFLEQGFMHTSMDQIANKAGVSKQTVYSHFGSKNDLFEASIAQKTHEHKMVGLEPDSLPEARIALRDIAGRFLSMITSPEAMAVHRTCISAADSQPEIPRLFFKAGPNRVITELSACMEEFDRRGELDIPDYRFAAAQFLFMLQGEYRMHIEYRVEDKMPAERVEAYIDSCVSLFVRGYRPE